MSVVVGGETGDTSKDGDNDKEREKTKGDSTASLLFTRRWLASTATPTAEDQT